MLPGVGILPGSVAGRVAASIGAIALVTAAYATLHTVSPTTVALSYLVVILLVASGWEEAYEQRFSGAAGSKGDRPIVVSYASSPPAEVFYSGKKQARATTGVVLASCVRQVELDELSEALAWGVGQCNRRHRGDGEAGAVWRTLADRSGRASRRPIRPVATLSPVRLAQTRPEPARPSAMRPSRWQLSAPVSAPQRS